MNIFGGSNKNGKNQDLEKLLDTKLYKFPGTENHITWADSVEGALILGATGSGKTSGPAKLIALSQLRSGFGLCVLCAKKEERERWERYAQEAGRSEDVIVLNKASSRKFNFLQYEMNRKGEGAGDVLNVINILMNLNEQSRVYTSGSGGNKDERFWDESLKRLISRTIGLLRLSGEEISITNMRKIVSNSFRENDVNEYAELNRIISSVEELSQEERTIALTTLTNWANSNYFLRLIERIQRNHAAKTDQAQLIMDYWLKEFARLSEKTSSIIVESFMGIIEAFMNDGILKDQFSKGLDEELLPESIIQDKKLLIIDFPIKEFGLSAVFAATIYKTAFQAACERREISNEEQPMPVGLFIDEYQSFCNPVADSLFQATARSSWVACTYITQNINNLFFVMGDSQPEARTKALLGNLNLKIFANNADYTTNEWASDMIGKTFINLESANYDQTGRPSMTSTKQYHHKIAPDHFTHLKKGRKQNRYKVEAVVFKPGLLWGQDQQNYAIVEFDQK